MRILNTYTIISDIYRDLGLDFSDWEADAVEWIGRAITRIRGKNLLQKRVIPAKVENRRYKIDSCIHKIRWIEYKQQKLPEGTSDAHYLDDSEEKTELQQGKIYSHFYVKNFDYLNFSFETGDIKLHVNSLPLDEKGYPLIADIEEVRDYINYYILEKLLLRGSFTHPDPQLTYSNIEAKNRNIYLPKARNATRKVSPEAMHKLMSLMTNLYPNIVASGNLFINEERRTHKI